ncbi:LuxR C-terminal-related transcriptional regulator [Pseudomonas sp. DCB_AW]|uniref:helix-turn-helix transcriptional regulator n=1 Tax=Pseudomonas sp. DCB_AW TaxID=2993596 RepID=UPI002248ED27|nr:LuxR C-terminal-related transcriptional regulator [Pseudomonas sp. DCB_AW]MCX2689101.1 LuxR C-terminal-related transcriptional regulator [Pseudomonas sp. DCB_AW]
MNSHLLYPQIGKVIASTGSRQFPRMLHDLIQAHLTIDATHIRLLPVAPAGPDANAPVINETVFTSDVQPSRDCSDPTRLHLIRRKGDARYEIHVLRADSTYGFSAFERNRLDDISLLLLPMLEKHIDALQPAAERATQESLEQRFLDRLAQSGLKLSERERQVCLGLLAGHTAPEQAERLELKVNTVESYLRRAAIKLGISGRHSLMRWMYTAV